MNSSSDSILYEDEEGDDFSDRPLVRVLRKYRGWKENIRITFEIS